MTQYEIVVLSVWLTTSFLWFYLNLKRLHKKATAGKLFLGDAVSSSVLCFSPFFGTFYGLCLLYDQLGLKLLEMTALSKVSPDAFIFRLLPNTRSKSIGINHD